LELLQAGDPTGAVALFRRKRDGLVEEMMKSGGYHGGIVFRDCMPKTGKEMQAVERLMCRGEVERNSR
jgi:hypothetical protein